MKIVQIYKNRSFKQRNLYARKRTKKAAKQFAEFWKDKGYEKGQSQTIWLQLLSQVYGIERPEQYIEFEEQVHIDKNTGFIKTS